MSLAILARSPAFRRQALSRARGLHTTSPVRGGHGDYHHLPFAWPGNKKFAFGLKLTAFLATGFAIPIVAAKYQLDKAKSG